MTERGKVHGEREFRAATHDGELVGWLRDGPADVPPALLLHGGPGLNDYLQSLADELDGLFPIARYQQRGVTPSTESGPRDVETHVEDVAAVLDALGWSRAVVVGHSWGGHLVMHFAVAHPERLIGFVSIDPLGAVGDGGLAPFVEFLSSHVPDADRPRYEELESRERLTDAEREESFRMVWPFYFADPANAPAFPGFRFDSDSSQTWLSINHHLEAGILESRLPEVDLPFLVIHGEKSPIPIANARLTAQLVPNGRLAALPGVGHWAWLEQPGSVRAEMARFLDELPPNRS